MVKSTACQGSLAANATFCKSCRHACLSANLRKHICKKAYFIDLVVLAWKLFYKSEKEAMQYAADMRKADYMKTDLAGQDMDAIIGKDTPKLDIVRNIVHKAECIPAERRTPALKHFLQSYLIQPRVFHSTDTEAQAHAALAGSLASSIATGQTSALDLKIAAKVASGQSSLSNKRRKNTRKYFELEAAQEALITLGRREEVEQLLQRFHVNAKVIPTTPLHQTLPNAFLALNTDAEAIKSVQKCLAALKLPGQRAVVLMDETVWAVGCEAVSGLKINEDGFREAAFVGGHWDPEDDWSYLPCRDYPAAELPKDADSSPYFICLQMFHFFMRATLASCGGEISQNDR